MCTSQCSRQLSQPETLDILETEFPLPSGFLAWFIIGGDARTILFFSFCTNHVSAHFAARFQWILFNIANKYRRFMKKKPLFTISTMKSAFSFQYYVKACLKQHIMFSSMNSIIIGFSISIISRGGATLSVRY